MSTLTEFQRIALNAAAQREDRCLVPPPKLKGGQLKAFEERLIAAGVAREIRAKQSTPLWRTDPATGRAYSLRLTIKGEKAGAEAAAGGERGAKGKESSDTNIERAADGASESKDAKRPKVDRLSSAAQTPTLIAPATIHEAPGQGGVEPSYGRSEPRANSKLAQIVGLLSRDGGATLVELTMATGWLPHTTRAALTRLRQRGFGLERSKREAGGASIFRITADHRAAYGADR